MSERLQLLLTCGLADPAPALAVERAVLDAAALGRAPAPHAHLVLQAVAHRRALGRADPEGAEHVGGALAVLGALLDVGAAHAGVAGVAGVAGAEGSVVDGRAVTVVVDNESVR